MTDTDLIARTVRGEGFLNGGFEFVWIGDRKLTAKQVCEAADRIERLEAMLEEAREATLREAADRARRHVIWVLKGHDGRENVADRVAESILSLAKRKPTS